MPFVAVADEPEAVVPTAPEQAPQVRLPEAQGAAGIGAQLCPLTDSEPVAQLAVTEPVKPEVAVLTTVDWPLASAGIVNEQDPNVLAVPAHGLGLQDALRPPQVPLAQVASAVPVKPTVLLPIDGVDSLVVDGKLNVQPPCVSAEAAQEAAGEPVAFGSVQRARPLTIW